MVWLWTGGYVVAGLGIGRGLYVLDKGTLRSEARVFAAVSAILWPAVVACGALYVAWSVVAWFVSRPTRVDDVSAANGLHPLSRVNGSKPTSPPRGESGVSKSPDGAR